PLTLFFVTPPQPTQIYTLSLHDALPISFESTPELAAAYGEIARQSGLDRRMQDVRDTANRALDVARTTRAAGGTQAPDETPEALRRRREDMAMATRVEADALITLGGACGEDVF